MLDPKGRVVMVSGANRGIGLAIARRLHEQGYALSLGARDLEKLAAAVADFDKDRLLLAYFEARDRDGNARWVERTAEHFGRIDGLVNCAGISPMVDLEDPDEAAYDELWEINVKGPLRLTRLALPHLRLSGTGRVVNIGSLAGKRIFSSNAGYAISKFAVTAMTHVVRRVGWDDGVRATVICPGSVDTDMMAGRPGPKIAPEDIAELVATSLALPNDAVVAEILVNSRYESMF